MGETTALQIGELVEGKGIYVGTWEPKDRDGNSLGKIFNLYAAPEDIYSPEGVYRKDNGLFIPLLFTFNEAVAHVAGLRGWYGHDGFNHNVSGKTPDDVLYDALRTGSYNGEWFIPTKDALISNLYKNKDEFKAQRVFTTEYGYLGGRLASWYCSSTEHRDKSDNVWIQSFTKWASPPPRMGDDGVGSWYYKDGLGLSTRLVRAELCPSV